VVFDSIDVSYWSDLNVFNTYMCQLCMMLAAFCLCHFVSDAFTGRKRRVAKAAVLLSALLDSVLVSLSFVGVTVIYDTLPYWVAAQFVLCLLFMVFCALEVLDKSAKRLVPVSAFVLFAAMLLDFFGVGANMVWRAPCAKIVFSLLLVIHLVVAGKGIVTTMFYDGAVLRGIDGNRFMLTYGENAERVPKDVQSKCICDEIRRHGSTPHGGVWFDATGVPEEKWQGAYKPYLNRYLACGIDLRKEPVEIAPAAHTTCGGVWIRNDCLTGVSGLLACGEVTGGIHGANRLGGNAGLETMVFGRIAGKSAIVNTEHDIGLPAGSEPIPNQTPDVAIEALRTEFQQILRRSLNVIRCEEDLQQGLEAISRMFHSLGDHQTCYEKHRLYNDLLTAYLAMLSALERKGSIGCHYRQDAVTEESVYRVVIQKDGEEMNLCRTQV
jgi:succinate dehydrogenase/fumarate reductase flavoprotein subunit